MKRLSRLTAFWLALAVGPSGCGLLETVIEDEVRNRVSGRIPEDDGGGGGDGPIVDGGGISINSVQPNRGSTTGGLTVEILGFGFTSSVEVDFGSNPATGITVLSEYRIQCITPPRSAPGSVGVVVRDTAAGESVTLADGFEYFDPVTVDSITPSRGPTSGGTELTIVGTGFVAGTRVSFNGANEVVATVVDLENLSAVTPVLPHDLFSVTVANVNGAYTFIDGFHTYEPVTVGDVAPFAGPLSGGIDVTLLGTGFIDPSTATFAALAPVSGTANDDEDELLVVLPTKSAPEGPVNVRANNTNGNFTLERSFVYFDDSDDTPRLIAALPPGASIGGGDPVRIVGVGFVPDPPAPTTITIGGEVADCTVIDDNQVTCTTPAGAEGSTIIHATNPGGLDDTLPFTYVDLQLDSVSPDEGAIAGGTYVHVFGNGFGSDTKVYFDGQLAVDIDVISDDELTARTPSGTVGPASVRVVTLGIDLEVAGLFTYFDPTNYDFWTGGGPIDGAINVTVIDYYYGDLLADAFVLAGATVDVARPYLNGYTNAAGQITLSGPDVFGPHSVHAFKDGYAAGSYIETDAQNLMIALIPDVPPPPDPLPECGGGGGGEGGGPVPPLVRGRIHRVKDQWNTGSDLVLVSTTYVNFGAEQPDPGPRAQLNSQGDYEAFVRPGDLVLIARAGYIGASGFLVPHAMGFRPFVYTEMSSGALCTTDSTCDENEECWRPDSDEEEGVCVRVYDDMDIVIDTPLNQPLQISFDNPPLGLGSFSGWAQPTLSYALVWYDFGSAGVHSMGTTQGSTATLFLNMPRSLPAAIADTPFHVDAQVYGSTAAGGTTWSANWQPNNLSTVDPVIMTPMLRVLRETTPVMGATLGKPMSFVMEELPASGAPRPTAFVHRLSEVIGVPLCFMPGLGPIEVGYRQYHWMAIAPGDVLTMDLPFLTAPNAGLNPPAKALEWRVVGEYSPAADYDNLDLTVLFDWVSETGRRRNVTIPF